MLSRAGASKPLSKFRRWVSSTVRTVAVSEGGTMTESDWVLILTGALVLVTAYYAKQTHDAVDATRETVQEMRRARELQVMPHLVPAREGWT